MTRLILTISSLLVLVGCTSGATFNPESGKYNFTCELIGNSYMRCENQEVVCYNMHQEFSCFPKTPEPKFHTLPVKK